MRTRHFLCLAVLLLSGCGYQLGEIKPTPMRGVRNLAVPTFENKTLEPRIEALVTDTVIKQFQQDGTYSIVSEKRADAILYARITEVDRNSVRAVLSNVLASSEFELHMEVEFRVVDRVSGRVLIPTTIVRGITPFFTSPDLQTDERQAMPLAAQKMAVDMVSAVSEGW